MAALERKQPWEPSVCDDVRDGSSFARLLADQSDAFHAWLGDGFERMGEDGLALAFACVVAARRRLRRTNSGRWHALPVADPRR
jgi:hypothetical protein